MIKSLIQLIRPAQWLKNVFVFLPMFFGGHLTNGENWLESIIAFFAFAFAASAIYCLNDIKDIEADRLHPEKRSRPLASGLISVRMAAITMIILMGASIGFCFIFPFPVSIKALIIILIYLILNTCYCFRLKQIAIIDVMIVAFGFVLRLLLGGVVCSIWLSPWIVCLTFLLALFLAFAKRRDDVVILNQTGVLTRKNIKNYNLEFLNQTLGILGAVTIVCYIMYTLSPEVMERLGSEYLYITSVFVIGCILRYLQLAIVSKSVGSPTKVLYRDRFIQIMIVSWLAVFIVILYL